MPSGMRTVLRRGPPGLSLTSRVACAGCTWAKAPMTDKVEKTDAQWQKELTPDQFYVLRQAGTERAFTGALWDNHEHGIYYCAACGLALFKSETKFDSGTGWPSFYAPISKANIIEDSDRSLG